ncbi:hypothetical protein ABB27_08720 [Stenotrophomonas terrae]|uniref:Endonuclease/exonuclease/phosphatase domain-containing protein n=1 Tax=Stenotrophomonas terrae TaxID=405446 RepID=A0A0R0CPE8_9GAMM|nr:hypothetical protein ABB27_08720 [Stenotrophomonas terrae]
MLVLSFGVLAEPVLPVIKIANLRLPDSGESWVGQRDRIAQLMESLRPDVIIVQDVRQRGTASNPACWLGTRLKYSCDFISADRPSQSERRGNAVLTRLTAQQDGITLLHGDEAPAAAGMQRLQLQQALLNIYAASMCPTDNTAVSRGHQAADLRSWMDATAEGLPSLIIGDFAAPTEELVRQLPGYQPARRNPSNQRSDADPAAGARHGLDVLYQVRSFADITQQPIQLPASDAQTAPEPLGMMATLRITRIPASVDAEQP